MPYGMHMISYGLKVVICPCTSSMNIRYTCIIFIIQHYCYKWYITITKEWAFTAPQTLSHPTQANSIIMTACQVINKPMSPCCLTSTSSISRSGLWFSHRCRYLEETDRDSHKADIQRSLSQWLLWALSRDSTLPNVPKNLCRYHNKSSYFLNSPLAKGHLSNLDTFSWQIQ